MDDNGEQHRSDPFAEFAPISSWPQLGPDSDGRYFFGADRDSAVLSEFGWNLPGAGSVGGAPDCFGDVDQIIAEGEGTGSAPRGSDAASGAAGDASTSNRSASSGSSEDPPERSAASGESLLAPEKPSRARKKGQKRIKQPRFAFMTKSEVDHLEDGYRWRKYGQKAVKNSPFPRSYYRCTNSKCTVKKRVERSSEDPATVITTYEGQHCHHSAGYLRSSSVISHEAAFGRRLAHPASQIYRPTRVLLPLETSPHNSNTHSVPTSSGDSQRLPTSSGECDALLGANQVLSTEGLLADVVPPGMR
ncbi:probable WRKY transcription factor 57 [Rhodamnia argentea]|uniref:Probable WRKY transcription factor 57 n=1 Tax=Rhodamnia argentea TaxID=178133 RepID=A0A8B8MY71_9MYRT|nr:probable WRKY transcription factor 57 [Rhodamnia argentea]XP_048137230.1 probable WRKY transcription factor 57 [Rhodamnia argentea]